MNFFKKTIFFLFVCSITSSVISAECPTQETLVPGYSGAAGCFASNGSYQVFLQTYIYDPLLSPYVRLYHNNGMGVSVNTGYGLSCTATVPSGGYVTIEENVCPPPTALSIASQPLGMNSSEQTAISVNTNHRLEPTQTLSISGASQYSRQIEYKVVNTGSGSNRNWTALVTLSPYDNYADATFGPMVLNLGLLGRSTYTNGAPGLKIFFRARSVDENNKKSQWGYSRGVWLYTDRLASSGSYGNYLAPYCGWNTPPTQPGQTVLISNLLCPVNNGSTMATKVDRAPWSPGTNCTFHGGISGSTCLSYIVE